MVKGVRGLGDTGGYGKGGQRSRRHWGAMVKGVRGLGDTGGYGKGGQGSRRHYLLKGDYNKGDRGLVYEYYRGLW